MTLIFGIIFFLVFGNLFVFLLKAGWALTRIFLYILFLPLIVIGCVMSGFIYIAAIILIVAILAGIFRAIV